MASSRSSSSIEQRSDHVVNCLCNCTAKVARSWTEKNPGRRFYTCRGRTSGNRYENCRYFEWFDVEKPHGWQHEAFLEARNIMNRQNEEIKNLKEIIASRESKGGREEIREPSELVDNLKREVLIVTERSIVYRNVLITLAIVFAIANGFIVALWKK